MKEINYEFEHFEIKVNAEISILKDFVKCKEFIKTPFSNSSTVMPVDFNYNDFEKIVIRCILSKSEETKILKSAYSPQSFCVKIIEKFVEENWLNSEVIIYKTLTCNPAESQYMYLIKSEK